MNADLVRESNKPIPPPEKLNDPALMEQTMGKIVDEAEYAKLAKNPVFESELQKNHGKGVSNQVVPIPPQVPYTPPESPAIPAPPTPIRSNDPLVVSQENQKRREMVQNSFNRMHNSLNTSLSGSLSSSGVRTPIAAVLESKIETLTENLVMLQSKHDETIKRCDFLEEELKKVVQSLVQHSTVINNQAQLINKIEQDSFSSASDSHTVVYKDCTFNGVERID